MSPESSAASSPWPRSLRRDILRADADGRRHVVRDPRRQLDGAGVYRGDLAVVRKQSSYRAGDVVLYDSREFGTKVLHRIVRVDGGRFVLKGDNNSFLDEEWPTEEQILGTLWVSARRRPRDWRCAAAAQRAARRSRHPARPRGGPAPAPRSAGIHSRGNCRAPSRPASGASPGGAQALLAGLAAAALVCVGLAVVSFSRPLTGTEPVEAAYAHQGRFDYQGLNAPERCVSRRQRDHGRARLPPPRPAPARVVRLPVESQLPVDSGGRIALDARLSDGRGWERTIPPSCLRNLRDGGSTISGVLDLRRIERIVEEVRRLTGLRRPRSPSPCCSASTSPAVSVASVSTPPSRRPSRSISTTRACSPASRWAGVGPFAPRELGGGTRTVPAELSFGALSLSVSTARRVSLVGIAALLLLAGVASAVRRRGGEPDEHEAIHSRWPPACPWVAARSGEDVFSSNWPTRTRLRARRRASRQADPAPRGRPLLRGRGREHCVPLPDPRARAGGDDAAACRRRPARSPR